MKTFYLITFGCKLNQAESDMISADLISLGLKPASQPLADLIIVNACAVTAKAELEVTRKIHQLQKFRSRAKIIFTGCFSIQEIPGVDLVVPGSQKEKIKKIVAAWLPPAVKLPTATIAPQSGTHPHRAFIKIQTGCHNFCSYCLVPFLRGLPVSRPASQIVTAIKKSVGQGLQEVVLTGVNIGLYETQNSINSPKNNSLSLVELLRLILSKTDMPRIRLGSLWPTHITPGLIRLYAKEPRLLPHFHLSIQSGSNRILKLMNRRYTREEVIKITRACRRQIPDVNFTCDIIVGFPGETEKDFQNTCDLVKTIGFSKVHIFQFSPRPNTGAAAMSGQIPGSIKKARYQRLFALAEIVARREKNKFKNKKLPVLWEGIAAGWQYGFTSNYLRVKKKVKPGENWENQIEEFRIKNFI
ncbi:tRNA (N(6)-L-threonylcarbamoyladenosine(37)-C(2))-methylthiotransferase MtaB [Candidatus Kuenenbacteria bacterium]|nr:tRNA (N(6)-L-threonylcarbamoyladenosine(37)-C(2))-methylthiotransferase MtaB [Candidatus Kuenenbacteria bacterium]